MKIDDRETRKWFENQFGKERTGFVDGQTQLVVLTSFVPASEASPEIKVMFSCPEDEPAILVAFETVEEASLKPSRRSVSFPRNYRGMPVYYRHRKAA